MGQKVNPNGFRLGIIYDWKSRWFAKKGFGDLLEKDIKIREYIVKKLKRAGISKVEIERAGDSVKVDIHTARPGIVIGKKGAEVDVLRSELEKISGEKIQINIQEVKRPELDANLVAQSIADQLEARVSFRRAMKRAVGAAMKNGAKGVRINCAGRLGGAEMARREWYREGRVPLHTLRADIDYGFARSNTLFGAIGVKVWIYKGDVIRKERQVEKGTEGRATGVKEAREGRIIKVKVEEKKELAVKAEAKVEIKAKTEIEVKAKEKVENKVKTEVKAKTRTEEAKTETKTKTKEKTKAKVEAEIKIKEKAKTKKEAKAETKTKKKEPKTSKKSESKERAGKISKEIKSGTKKTTKKSKKEDKTEEVAK